MFLINFFIRTRATDMNLRYRERAIRIIVGIALIFFTVFGLIDLLQSNLVPESIWYWIIYLLCGVLFSLLYFGKVEIAGRILMFGIVLIVIDPTVAYWSPGTIILGLLFTFMAQIVLDTFPERVLAITINLGIYTYLAMTTTAISPMPLDDYYSDPYSAIITTYVAHFILIGVAVLIRREQKLHYQIELLLEQQRADVLQQFLGHTSHDMRTLLARISSSLYLAKYKLADADNKAIKRLEASVEDMETLLLSMLEMAQLHNDSRVEKEKRSIRQLLSPLVDEYQQKTTAKSQQLIVNYHDSPIYIKANAEQFSRAIGNILQNAVNYTPENSIIRVCVRPERQYVTIDIQDTGDGIAPEHLPYIFDSFYRVDQARNQANGLNGLGLAISRKIIQLHSGTLTVNSQVGKGSTFSVRLPLAR